MGFDAYAYNRDGQSWDDDEHGLPLDADIKAAWRHALIESEHRRGRSVSEEELAAPGGYTRCGMLHGRACFVLGEVTGEPVYRDYNRGWLYWTSELVQRLQQRVDWSHTQRLVQDEQFLLDFHYAWRQYSEEGWGGAVIGLHLEMEDFWDDVATAQVFLEVCAANSFWIKFSP